MKVHGFGMTNPNLMQRYPWYSVDLSSWLKTGMYGVCAFRVGNKLKKISFGEKSNAQKSGITSYARLSKPAKQKIDSWIAPFGLTAEQLSEHHSFRDVVNAATFQGLEDLSVYRFTLSK